jgi:hypothetical protein
MLLHPGSPVHTTDSACAAPGGVDRLSGPGPRPPLSAAPPSDEHSQAERWPGAQDGGAQNTPPPAFRLGAAWGGAQLGTPPARPTASLRQRQSPPGSRRRVSRGRPGEEALGLGYGAWAGTALSIAVAAQRVMTIPSCAGEAPHAAAVLKRAPAMRADCAFSLSPSQGPPPGAAAPNSVRTVVRSRS